MKRLTNQAQGFNQPALGSPFQWENNLTVPSCSGTFSGFLGKSFPLFTVSDFTNIHPNFHNQLMNLLVSAIHLLIEKLGMQNAEYFIKLTNQKINLDLVWESLTLFTLV